MTRAEPGSYAVGELTAPRSRYREDLLVTGLQLMTLFTEHRPTWHVTDLAAIIQLPRPTVYRLVLTLVAEGYLDRLPDGEYRPGPRVIALESATLDGREVVAAASPRLNELASATRQTVDLCVLTGDRVLYLVRFRSPDLVVANIQVGSTLPAARTSIGKLLLAYLGQTDLTARVSASSFGSERDEEAARLLDRLPHELAGIRARGWAIGNEILDSGMSSVAAPIYDRTGSVIAGACIGKQSPDAGAEWAVSQRQPRIVEVCADISRILGHVADTS